MSRTGINLYFDAFHEIPTFCETITKNKDHSSQCKEN